MMYMFGDAQWATLPKTHIDINMSVCSWLLFFKGGGGGGGKVRGERKYHVELLF